jgi:transcriptional regulator with XRE-family HTH domain
MKNINELKKQIGLNLFKIRRERNLSIYQSALLMGVKKSKLDGLERGHGCMNLSKLIKYAGFYKVPVKRFFE